MSSLRSRPTDWRDAAPLLRPAVRATSWANAAASSTADRTTVPFGKPLVPFVKVVCAIDFEHSMSFATAPDLAAWGVSDEEALGTATANLARLRCPVRGSGPAALVLEPDGYASSWLAAPAALAGAAADVGGSVLAVAPTRDALVLVDAGQPDAVIDVLGTALEHYQVAARQLSPVPYLVSAAGIEPWLPSADHPARPSAEAAARYLTAAEYGHQRDRLEVLLRKAGEDVHLAKHTLMRRPEGSLWSWAPWVRQVTNGLLPQADAIVLGDTDHPDARFAVRWDDAMRIAGDVLHEEAQYSPPLWRYHGWPDAATVAALAASAVPLPPPSAT